MTCVPRKCGAGAEGTRRRAAPQYCKWFLDIIRNCVSIPDKTFFTDEAWLTLHEVLLHAEKIGVLYAVSHTRDVGPLFFESTADGAVYGDIQQQFMAG